MTETKEKSTDNQQDIIIYGNPHYFLSRDISVSFNDVKTFDTYIKFAYEYFKAHPDRTSVSCTETGGYNALKRVHETDELIEGKLRHVKYILIDWKY